MLIIAILVAGLLYISNKKKFQVKDEIVDELYAYFQSDNLESCNGLFNYSDKKVDYESIDNETKLCLAYKNSDTSNSIKETANNDKKKLICTIDKMIFRVNDDEKECDYTKIDKNIINKTYNKIFGKDIEDVSSFQLDNLHICYVKKDAIYCGLSEIFTYILGSSINVCRVIEKTVEKSSKVEIYDYFLKVTDDKCYGYYTTASEKSECSNKLPNNAIKYNLIKKYGTLYKHTFNKKDDGSYYWVSSEPIN